MTVDPFIEAEQAQHGNVTRACQLLEVSRSAYYARRHGPSPRQRADAELTDRILAVHEASGGSYGSPRIHTELAEQGHRRPPAHQPGHRAVACRGGHPSPWRSTTAPARPSDGAHLPRSSRNSYARSNRPVLQRQVELENYTSFRFSKALKDNGILTSMGSTGDSYDNAMMENFWSTLKIELVYRTSWRTRTEAENAIFEYIDGFYNPRRIQKELGYRSPDQYEAAYHQGALDTPASADNDLTPAGAR